MLTKIPRSIAEVIETFGSLDDPDFEKKNIVVFDFPYAMKFGSSPAKRGRCHRLVVENMVAALADSRQYLEGQEYGGCYAKRNVRGGKNRSMHSWGIAIDLMPEKFPRFSHVRLPKAVIDAFAKSCFFYGGDFRCPGPDPMHFQLAGDI